MAGEALLGFLSGVMKKKEEKFKEDLKRRADANALFEEIKSKNKPQEFETWMHKKTGKQISVPKTANQLERMSYETQGYVSSDVYNKVKPEPKKEKIPYDKLPEEIKTIVPYWESLDQSLQNTIIESYTEEALKQQKLVHPTGSTKPATTAGGLLNALQQLQATKKQTDEPVPERQTGVLPSTKNVPIPSKILDYIKNTTIITQKANKKGKAKVTTTRPLLDAGFIKRKDGYFLPRFIDATR